MMPSFAENTTAHHSVVSDVVMRFLGIELAERCVRAGPLCTALHFDIPMNRYGGSAFSGRARRRAYPIMPVRLRRRARAARCDRPRAEYDLRTMCCCWAAGVSPPRTRTAQRVGSRRSRFGMWKTTRIPPPCPHDVSVILLPLYCGRSRSSAPFAAGRQRAVVTAETRPMAHRAETIAVRWPRARLRDRVRRSSCHGAFGRRRFSHMNRYGRPRRTPRRRGARCRGAASRRLPRRAGLTCPP